jgi:HAD superfamily hydrolase (TIGR01509 family)
MLKRLTPKNLRAYPAHIFDMDGTLLNSEPLHLKALISIFSDSGIDTQKNEHELAEYCVGKSDEEVFLDFSPEWSREQAKKAVEDKNKMILEILDKSSEKDIQELLTQDISEYLKLLNKLGRKCFVLTASEQSIVAPILEKAGLFNFFLDVQSRNQSFRTKPSSSPYLSLMRKHQLTTNEVIIYEDSPTGLSAAQGTGAHVIHITAHCRDNMLSEFKHLQQADNFSWLLEKTDF